MITLYRQDKLGDWIRSTTNTVNRFERLKVEVESSDWLSTTKFTLTGMGLNPIKRNLGTDTIAVPGYNKKSSINFESPSQPGTYTVQATWKDFIGLLPIAKTRNASITLIVADDVPIPPGKSKKSIIPDLGIGSTLKSGSYLVFGILGLLIFREFGKK